MDISIIVDRVNTGKNVNADKIARVADQNLKSHKLSGMLKFLLSKREELENIKKKNK